MRAKQVVKKIVALGTGLSMVGASLFAAGAASLSDYPNPLFIKNGVFDGLIVVGDDAAASDVIGSIDIATALQAESIISEPSAVYAATPSVAFAGDVAEIGQPNDLLELQEPIGDVRETLTERDLNALKGGVITTDEGTTDYNQYLRFSETGTNAFDSDLTVVYEEDEDDNVGDFLKASDASTAIMFEYEIEFEEGAESEIESGSELEDLEDEIINLLGTPFAIADTDINTAARSLTIEMLGGAVSDIMEEGETKTYTIEDREYEVNVLIISDQREIVKFKINGEITDELRDGETDILKDGTRIGIREILPNEAEEVTGGDLVEFYLGATEVEWTDNNFSDQLFDGSTEVNDENIEDAQLQIRGSLFSSNSKFEITTIKYRLAADTLLGDLYVPPGHGIREYLDEPEGMLSPNWDIVYGGLMDTGVSIMKFDASGDDEYDLRFTTQEGLNYNIEFIDNDETTGFRIGDDDDQLIWIEGDNSVDYYISEDSEFILTDDNDETGFTHVVAFESFDSSDNELTFTDLYGETREFTAQTETGTVLRANLIFGGNTFVAFMNTSITPVNLSIDLTNDGIIGNPGNQVANVNCTSSDIQGFSINGTGGLLHGSVTGNNITARTLSASTDAALVGPCRATIVIQGGGILDLGVVDGRLAQQGGLPVGFTNSTGTFAPALQLNGNEVLTVGLKTLQSEFDEDGPRNSGGDEVVYISFENRSSGSETGLNVETAESRFPLDLEELKENEDIERDMTDYGVLVELFDPEGSDEAEDLTIEYPLVQRGVHVFVVAGDFSLSAAAGGAIGARVSRIAVGTAKLASEVEDITAVNAIVVGGPCANSAAAALMGNPENCAAGFEPGKAMIKLFESGNKVSLLVAGYEELLEC